MKRWRFKGAKLQTVQFWDYFVAGAGAAAAGAGGGVAGGGGGAGAAAAGAGAALPAVAEGAGVTFAAACGWALGLIQQAWTRSSRLFGTLSSIWAPKRVRQRKAACT